MKGNNRRGSGSKVRYVPGSTRRICQTTGDADPEGLPHINNTTEWGVAGTDMGAPVEHQGKLYIFFGDVPEFDDADPIAYTTDPDPEPHGFRLTPVLQDGPGTSFRPLRVKRLTDTGYLGTNETPTGAFSYDGRLYVFVVTGDDKPVSSLTSSADPGSDFELHRQISDSSGKFWQVAPWVVNNSDWPGLPENTGDGVLLWGQAGRGVYLAWMKLEPGRGPSGELRYYTGLEMPWSERESDADSLFPVPNITQLSVAWLPEVQRWLMLYSRAYPDLPREGIVCRVAKTPWDWSEEVTIFDPARDGAFGRYMHEPGSDDGLDAEPPRAGWSRVPFLRNLAKLLARKIRDNPGWAYAPFLLNRYTRWDPQERTAKIYYLMSTSVPYQVMLMRTELEFCVED